MVPRMDILAVALLVVFVLAVLIAPAAMLVWNSVMGTGSFSFKVFVRLATGWGYQRAIVTSLLLAVATSSIGTFVGAVLALILHHSAGERFRSILLALSTVATNYGGLPLAFGLILLFGSQGMFTLIFRHFSGHSSYLELASFWGLVVVFLYFLIPLCILTFLPALAALRAELRDAAAVHGANSIQFWRYIGIPILLPPAAASFVLLFVNSVGSFTTPWALVGTGTDLTLMTLQIGFLFGEAGYEPEVANGLAVLIIFISSTCVFLYHILMSRMARWVR